MSIQAPLPDADVVAAAVATVPSVRLHEGSTVATYLPGRRVPGVRVRDDGAEVHIALVYPTTVAEGATAVRAALAGIVSGPVDVVVADVLTQDAATQPPPTESLEELPEVGHA